MLVCCLPVSGLFEVPARTPAQVDTYLGW